MRPCPDARSSDHDHGVYNLIAKYGDSTEWTKVSHEVSDDFSQLFLLALLKSRVEDLTSLDNPFSNLPRA